MIMAAWVFRLCRNELANEEQGPDLNILNVVSGGATISGLVYRKLRRVMMSDMKRESSLGFSPCNS